VLNDNMDIKIEKNIPIPCSHSERRISYANILRKMEKYDSIVVKNNAEAQVVRNVARRIKMKIVTRKLSNSQIRIWLLDTGSG